MSIDNNGEPLTAKQLAELVGEQYHTIDHWTNMGLLKPKKKGRKRYYDKDKSVIICKLIRERQDQDMPLVLIAKEIDKKG